MIKEFDELKVYCGQDYAINENIVIRQPKLKEIVEYGEKEYFKTVNGICSTPSDMMVQLTDMGLDFVNIDDFQLFMMLCPNYNKKQTKIILGDLDLSTFEPYDNPENNETVLYNADKKIIIDKFIYQKIVGYIRVCHRLKANHDVPGTSSARKVMIEIARQDALMAERKSYKSNLKNLISAMINLEGYKYNLEETLNLTIYQFMDCVHRIQAIIHAKAMLNGIYGGMVDTSKMTNKENLDMLRELD